MQPTTTLCVMCTDRGAYIAHDQIAAVRWGCSDSVHTLIIDENGKLQDPGDFEGYSILRRDRPYRLQRGFQQLAALHYAIDRGWQFQQAMLLTDDTLITGKEIDRWTLASIEKSVGFLGVEDRYSHDDAYGRVANLFAEWDIPYETWDPTPKVPSDKFLVISQEMLKQMFQRGLLAPEEPERWPLPFATYISWVGQILGFYQGLCGHVDKQQPPLYINPAKGNRCAPAPHILKDTFAVYYSLRNVPAYNEEELRTGYRRIRASSK